MARTGSERGPNNELALANHRGRLDLPKRSAKTENNYLIRTRFFRKRFPGSPGDVLRFFESLFDAS